MGIHIVFLTVLTDTLWYREVFFLFVSLFLFENTQSNGWIDRTSVLSEISERVEREPDGRGFFKNKIINRFVNFSFIEH